MKILSTKGINKKFGAISAAQNLNIEIEENTVVGLIGSNGAGKTTFINIVTGYIKPTTGSIYFKNEDITFYNPRKISNIGICRSFQIPQLFNSLSVYENLEVALNISCRNRLDFFCDKKKTIDKYLNDFSLDFYKNKTAGFLPEGIRKLVDIALAMISSPKILLLDEPTSGVSSEEKFNIMDMVINVIKSNKITVLFVEHDMEIIKKYAKRLLAFYDGSVIADGETKEILKLSSVKKYVTGNN